MAADPELEAIRQRRLAQLSGAGPGSSGNSSFGPTPGSSGTSQDPEAAAQQAAEEDEARRTVMSQILDPQARERLARIKLVRPERERSLQEILLRMARSGQLRGRVTDEQLLGLLDQVAAAESRNSGSLASSKITVSRRRDKTISDDEEDSEDDKRASNGNGARAAGKTERQGGHGDDDDDDIFDL